MYEAFWGLQRKPFENTADGRFYYPGQSHQSALLKLRYVVESFGQAAVLTGAPGLGKSVVVQTLFRQLADEVVPRIHVVFPQMPADQLLAYLAFELSGEPATRDMPTVEESVRTLRSKLQENVRAKHHALIVIDEAHLIQDPKTLDALRLLLNFETDGVGGLTLLFAGQPSLLPMIDRHRDLEERIAVKCLLRPLDLEETIAYVHHRLLAAGGSRPIFTNAALEALHALANGNPRQINRLCDLSLLIGFAEEQHEIDAPAVEAVSNELVSVTPE